MRKSLAILVLSVLSTSAMADELPLGLDTAVVGTVTVGQTLLVSAALIAGVAAASNSGGSSNGGTTTGTTGTTGTTN
ncbi:hypothetical protein [Pseudomonas sp. B14(2022)]|uniref:hypothetical protein n=1 Tax=Pseudomonas sp. B14(2022) TaxID=2914043 RepID=UPI00103F2622|nr:hypothetical protein [Pseudomonas sp. B14(2022)]NJJ57810.1 hypothetical protein [Pseudomonas sp. B14(2022)]